MTTTETLLQTLLLISFIVFGGWLYVKARKYGKHLKNKYEKAAKNSLDTDLAQIKDNIDEYSVHYFEKDIFGRYTRKTSTYQEMVEKVIHSCKVYTGKGTYGHGPAKYAIDINQKDKALNYVIGTNDFDFTQENT